MCVCMSGRVFAEKSKEQPVKKHACWVGLDRGAASPLYGVN